MTRQERENKRLEIVAMMTVVRKTIERCNLKITQLEEEITDLQLDFSDLRIALADLFDEEDEEEE